MPALHDITHRLSTYAVELFLHLSYVQLSLFFEASLRLLPAITLKRPRTTTETPPLPEHVCDLLSVQVQVPTAAIKTLWKALGDLVLQAAPRDLVSGDTVDCVLSAAGAIHGLGAETLVSPTRVCLTPTCPDHGRALGGDQKSYQAHLYTRRRGVLPVSVLTLYCRGCKTTYRPNYSVTHASNPAAKREYHSGMPAALEVTEHSYVEAELAVLFRTQIAFAQTSADTVAQIYNLGLSSGPASHPLSAEAVLNTFWLYALLQDSMQRGESRCNTG
ncbi:hypothetical protein K466DRAFT_605837 [Polyporus arcularius HHB13444]|uniref:CxC5 like cysteine cluster associated with KDZ domain-containing protein n=1 Tax=Polyporus arcularius HHB13444 TaxID=1314778 RepID=A0A5C3NUZ9_9APHY|nr:hypothetical protein K466DRAFT_605837 [Polyporus arcularius HHB13444]